MHPQPLVRDLSTDLGPSRFSLYTEKQFYNLRTVAIRPKLDPKWRKVDIIDSLSRGDDKQVIVTGIRLVF